MSRLKQSRLANLKLPSWLIKCLMNYWPPFRGASIRIEKLSQDFRYARVGLPLKLLNRNMWGVHFGGSLFAMTDALYAMMIKHNLGHDYVVWDKHASIDFIKPGRTHVHAEFRLDATFLQTARDATQNNQKYLPTLYVNIVDTYGDTIAEVKKTLYIRRK